MQGKERWEKNKTILSYGCGKMRDRKNFLAPLIFLYTPIIEKMRGRKNLPAPLIFLYMPIAEKVRGRRDQAYLPPLLFTLVVLKVRR